MKTARYFPITGETFRIIKETEIKDGIMISRKLFLEGDDECFIELGKTLHYIQDRWASRPRTRDKHTKWEN